VSGLWDKLGDAGRSLRDVFANPAMRRIQLAFAGSIVGDWAYAVAVALYAWEQGGPTAVGVLGVVRYVSLAVATPFTSMLGDRFPRRLVMISSDAIRAVIVLGAAAIIEADGPALAVYALAIVAAICGSPFRSAQASLLPELATDARELSAANVASSTVESVGFFAGPALAGTLLAFADIPTVYLFNALTFVWSAALVLGVRVPAREEAQPTAEEPERESFIAEASAGYRVIFGNRNLRLLIGLYCLQTIVAGASLVFTVSIALDLLDLGKSGLGFLNATLGIGGLVGGFVALVLAQRGRLARDFGAGVVLWSAPLLLPAAWPALGPAVACMVLLGLANSVVDVNAYTILQRLTPENVMARVFGAMESAVIGGMALGALLMPLLITTIGIRWGLAVVGGGVSVLVVAGTAGLRKIDVVALAPANVELFRRMSVFEMLPEPTLERLVLASKRAEARAGQVVIQEGDRGDLFYAIESGTVEVTKEGRHVAELGPGDYFGEIALLRDVPRTATVTATSACVFQSLERSDFIPAVTGHGGAAEAAETEITSRLRMLSMS
jgi:MFS family permease